MKELSIIGTNDPAISFIDRPTVKIVITRGDEILILNNGLLPGGGVDKGESLSNAIARELQEELGARVENIREIGQVTQYRTFLQKRYLVYGFTAELIDFGLQTNPQDEREKNFKLHWMTPLGAIDLINNSLHQLQAEHSVFKDDTIQSKVYNLTTSLKLIESIK